MKLLIVLVIVSLVSNGIDGWMFGENRIDPHQEISQECLNHAAWGTCRFYECLEERFPCGHRGYAYRVGLHFCRKITSKYDQLNESGLRWINGTARCLTEKLSPLYSSPFLRCGDIRDTGASAMVECNERVETDGSDFCWFVRENAEFYREVFGGSELGRIISLGPRVVAKVITEAITCGASTIRDRTSMFTSSVSEFFRNLVDEIDELLPWD